MIAYGKGGSLETIQDHETGIFFNKPDAESLKKAVVQFEKEKLSCEKSKVNALRFSRERYKNEMKDKLSQLLSEKGLSFR